MLSTIKVIEKNIICPIITITIMLALHVQTIACVLIHSGDYFESLSGPVIFGN